MSLSLLSVAALDLLIEEMCQYIKVYDKIFAHQEGDEYQAFIKALQNQISESVAKQFPGSPPMEWEEDPETEKYRKSDSNTAELGGMEKRLRHLQRLRKTFAETDPEDTSRALVHEIYRIFKLQIMWNAMKMSEELSSRSRLNSHTSLLIYSSAVKACVCIDESWSDENIYPFTDAKF